jgi:hypothetical protein
VVGENFTPAQEIQGTAQVAGENRGRVFIKNWKPEGSKGFCFCFEGYIAELLMISEGYRASFAGSFVSVPAR